MVDALGPSATSETFPFPEKLTLNRPGAEYASDLCVVRSLAAERRVNKLREAWLNPPDLVERVPEVVPALS